MRRLDPFDRQWERWFPERRDKEPVRHNRHWKPTKIFLALGVALALFIVASISKGFYTEWLWFSSLGYGEAYTTILEARLFIFLAAAVIFFLLFFGNVLLVTQLLTKIQAHSLLWGIVGLVAAVLSIIFGIVAQGNWDVVLRLFNGQPFGITDPVFHKEASFYIFSLPFFHFVRWWLTSTLIVTLIGSAAVYIYRYFTQRSKFDLVGTSLVHLGGLTIAILGLFAWGYWLGIWELVFSERGAVFGASYADIHAKLPALWILMATVLACITMLLTSMLRQKLRWALYGIGTWIVAAVVIGGIYPSLIQRFQVEPNELALEKPYIEYNIEFTREAFALNLIEEQYFPAEKSPSHQDIAQNEVTITNIRLWDPRPLKDTYNQIQSIRLYYDFHDVDVDRYNINGQYRQVMLSARELAAEKLAGKAQTWVNRQLQFTHGYGLALSPVNEVSAEGLPELLVKDIPPVGNFDIEKPQIYFGEKTNHYVIVKTRTQEFDYPMGDENVYGHYEGSAGVNIGSFMRRLVYAWQFRDFNILISNELTPDSRVLYYRNIRERVNHLAPFLKLDSDPYLVMIDGRLFWIQDAYTTTDRYPYSERLGDDLNYIRNSVKALIDAYNGDVTFYVTDPEDALIRTYQTIFPELFVSADQMPESLRVHLRYPEDLFNIQATVYRNYHMRDARVFYNKEDLWTIPKEIYAGNEQAMDPYYVIMRLPDEDKEEFLLMLPFTPVNKNNTIGWLAGRCDGENYGKLLSYLFPKERLVYGPSQIENRIQQDTTITEQLALWGRGGSRVIRGNLLMIPLGKSNLYVEPVFLQAEAGGLPELKRVIVAAGDQIAMAPSLDESISDIFSAELLPAKPEVEPPQPSKVEAPTTEPAAELTSPPEAAKPIASEMSDLIKQAQQHYNNAQQYLKEGDWANYGKELDALGTVLDQLVELTTEQKK